MVAGRRFLAGLTALAALSLTACGSPEASGGKPSKAGDPAPTATAERIAKPNILLVMTDDMRADDLRWMPGTRRFFEENGTDFRNSFAPTPLCCPNRASYLSGRYAHNHQVWWHDAPWGYGAFDDERTLAGDLQAAGYRTAYVGKYLNRYGIDAPKADPSHRPDTYVPPGWDEWRGTPDWTRLPATDPRAGSTYNYWDTTINANGVLEGHQGAYNSTVLVDESLKLLDGLEGGDKPWYLQLNSLAPHHGDPVERDDPPGRMFFTPAIPDAVRGKFDDQITRGKGVPAAGDPEPDIADKAWLTASRAPLTDGDRAAILEVTRQRAEALYAFDIELVRVLERLKESGALKETVVAFTSDNGYMLGEHRWQTGKVIGFEPSYRVPLLLAGAGIPRGEDEVMPVNTVDLSASVRDWAGAGIGGADGTSFVDLIGTGHGWERAMGYEAYQPAVPNQHTVPGFEQGDGSAIGIRTARWFYVRWANGDEELFDLRKDPLELESVAKDPSLAGVRTQLAAAWEQFHDCVGPDACRVPLPASLSVGQDEARDLTDTMEAEIRRYYG